jgi:hypothetical protein
MKRALAVVVACAALLAAPPLAPASPSPAPSAVIAKSCSGSYTHAVIGGSHKCLRRGQYCAHGRDREYHRYGFHCHKRDSYGSYHLT